MSGGSMRRAAIAMLLLLTSGCYAYTTVPPTDLTPGGGRELRLTLTDAGSAELWRVLGPRAEAVDGRVTARDSSAFSVAVAQVVRSSGTEERWSGELIRVPQPAVARVQSRRFSTARTMLVAGGLAVITYAVARIVDTRSDIGSTGGRPGTGGTTR